MLTPTETIWRDNATTIIESRQPGEPMTDEHELALCVLTLLARVEIADADLLALDDVAALLGVSRPTVSTLVHDGLLEAVSVGKRHRVPRAAVDRYRVENRVRPAAARFRLKPRVAVPA